MDSPLYKTPLKKVKNEKGGSGDIDDPLTFTATCKAYTEYRSWTSISTISKANGLEYQALRRKMNGRKKRLDERHKELLRGYVERGEVNSAHQAWQRLSGVANVKKVGYKVVNEYLKTLGTFVVPLLKTKISTENMKKRVEYAKEYLEFDFSRTLFTDESRFELNTNTLKVFQKKGTPVP